MLMCAYDTFMASRHVSSCGCLTEVLELHERAGIVGEGLRGERTEIEVEHVVYHISHLRLHILVYNTYSTRDHFLVL